VQQELNVLLVGLELVLPAFSYRAEMNGMVENELCPVFLCRINGTPMPDPTEVDDLRWTLWPRYVESARADDTAISPWSVLQVEELLAGGHVDRFLAG
jgi:isopentenyl-diphosphate delta-isomerase